MNKTLASLATEQPNRDTTDIDLYSTQEVLKCISDADKTVAVAVENEMDSIIELTEAYISTIKNGGRVFYIGCGTSGRMAYIDAAELVPTYNIPDDLVVAIMAGGLPAMRRAKEFAEDQAQQGSTDLKEYGYTSKDLLIGLAASGRTPYVIDAMNYAHSIGGKVGCIVCNRNTEMGSIADYSVEIEVGPEIVRGSTRMKSGTAEKLALNMISTAVFVRLGRTYKNLLINGRATTYKAQQRHIRTIMSEAGKTEEEAIEYLRETDDLPTTALVMAMTDCSRAEAEKLIEEHDGRLREAIASYKK